MIRPSPLRIGAALSAIGRSAPFRIDQDSVIGEADDATETQHQVSGIVDRLPRLSR